MLLFESIEKPFQLYTFCFAHLEEYALLVQKIIGSLWCG